MPQIAQLGQYWSSQIFWVLLIFGFVFFVIGRGMVPKVMATVALRDKQIGDDLAAAEAARKAADTEEESWRKREGENRAQAQAILAEARAASAKATEARLADVAARLDIQLAEADARINAAHDGAIGEIETVAAEAASDIVSRIAGVSVDPAAARAAVKEALHG
jgi:F-type H+-transporting ATPase subunit b